jgi:Ca2+-binding EF-hand superfamily protein
MLMHRSTHTRTNSTKIVNTSKHRKQKSHPFTSQPNVRTRITKEEQEDVREAFEIFDTDKDGMLDTFEFRVSHHIDLMYSVMFIVY